MKAVVAAFNQEKALVGAFSVITILRMELFKALRDIRISGMDIRDKDQFICWMQRALDQSDESHTDDNYIELYNILLRWQIEILDR